MDGERVGVVEVTTQLPRPNNSPRTAKVTRESLTKARIVRPVREVWIAGSETVLKFPRRTQMIHRVHTKERACLKYP